MITTTYIFLDTNVYVRFLPHNKLATLFKKLFPYKIIACKQLINEINSVAKYESIIKQIPLEKLNNYYNSLPIALEAIKLNADIFIDADIPILVEEPLRDEKDWYISNVALQYNCTVVSDDRDFTNWINPPFPILSIKDFLKNNIIFNIDPNYL